MFLSNFVYICNIKLKNYSIMKKTAFMKSNFAIYILWIVSLIVVLLIVVNILVVFLSISNDGPESITSTVSSASCNNTLKPIDEEIPTSLPYFKYNRLKDSIDHVRSLKNGEHCNAVFSPFGGAMSMQFTMNKDIVHKSRFDQFSIESPDSYFYVMKGWRMKSNEHLSLEDNTYYVENGVPYFRKYILKSTKGTHSNWEMTEKRLNYFYEKDGKTVLIPISKSIYNFSKVALLVIMFIFVSAYLVCASMAFKILHNISKGKVFIEENIRMLRQASYITILTPLLCVLIVLSQRLIFYNYFDDNIVMDMELYKFYAKLLLYGLAVSVLYSVFKRGFNIQQENDLVV